MNDDALRLAVREQLDQALVGAENVEDYLRAVLAQAAALVGVEGSYSISTTLYDRPMAVATSDRDAWDADQVEFDTNAGPCVSALEHGDVQVVADLREDDRWPTWATVALVLGFRSALGIAAAVAPDGHRIALNAYGRRPGAFGTEAVHRCELLLAEIARSLPLALRVVHQAGTITDLQAALVNRSVIDKALGVLMGQNRCSSDEAFALLRRASQNSNVKLKDVAAAIIERYSGEVPAPPTFQPPHRLPRRPAALSRTDNL